VDWMACSRAAVSWAGLIRYRSPFWSAHWSGAVGIQPSWKRVVTVAPNGPLTGVHLCVADLYWVIALFHAVRMWGWFWADPHRATQSLSC